MSALAGAGVLARASTPQQRTPLVDALRAYAALGTHAFHVPGHKRGHGASADLLDLVGPAVLAADVWLESGAFDAARRAAEELAAAAWGAHRAYLLGNGSTAGNLAWMLATLREGDEVVLARDAHTSTLAGLVLSGARPVWVRPRRHPVLDVGLGIEPAAVAAALRGHPRARVVGLVSPSYAGVCSDVPAIVATAHAAGALAVVGEAWGAHLAFHPGLSVPAIAAGADVVVTSVHKTLPALSSGSLLLAGPAADADRLAGAVGMTQTTSPLLPLLASIDLARRDLALDGHRLVGRAVSLAARLRRGLAAVPGLRVLDAPALGLSEARVDPLKVVVDVTGLGLSGLDAEARLRGVEGVAPEGSDLRSVYLVVTLGDGPASVAAAVRGFAALADGRSPRRHGGDVRRTDLGAPEPAVAVLTPRQAWQAGSRTVPLARAVGEVCAEVVTPYPPGIPVLVPGELVTPDTVDYLAEAVGRGVHVHGAADPLLATVRVVCR